MRYLLDVDYFSFSCESLRPPVKDISYQDAVFGHTAQVEPHLPIKSISTKLFSQVQTFSTNCPIEVLSFQRAGVRRSICVKMKKGVLPNPEHYFNCNLTRLDLKFDLLFFDDFTRETNYRFLTDLQLRFQREYTFFSSEKSNYCDELGSRTSYVGTRGKSHFCRVYEKLEEGVTRIEFEIKQGSKKHYIEFYAALWQYNFDPRILTESFAFKGCEFASDDFINVPFILKKTKTHALCEYLTQFYTNEDTRFWSYQQLSEDIETNKKSVYQYAYIFKVFAEKCPWFLAELSQAFSLEPENFYKLLRDF